MPSARRIGSAAIHSLAVGAPRPRAIARASAVSSAGQPWRGLGPVSRGWLAEVGVHTLADLSASDAIGLWLQVRQRHPRAGLNLLYALVGAQRGQDWRTVAREERSALLLELDLRRRLAE